MRVRRLIAIAALAASVAAAPPPADLSALIAHAADGEPEAVRAAAAEAARIGRTDPAREAESRMKLAESLMLRDGPKAATMVVASRAAALRATGPDSALVALADYRLALVRALGGDRAAQIGPMAAAAQRLATRAATPAERTSAALALIVAATFNQNSGQAALTDTLRDAALALMARPDLARTLELAEAYRVVADVFVFQNRPADALLWADRSVALYEALNPADPALVYALARRGAALQRLSRYPESLATLRRAVSLADTSGGGDPTVPLLALRALGFYYARVGEPDLALPLLKRALAGAEALPPGFPYAGGLARDIMQTLLDADRPEQARAYAEETAARTKANLGAGSYEYASALLVLARIDTRASRYAEAAARIDEADAVFARGLVATNGRRFEPLAARGALLAAQGRGAEAAALYDRARALLADLPPDDPDRIDAAADGAAALLDAGGASEASWVSARAAADGLTTRLVRQAAGQGAIDTEHGRSDRVYGTALDVAWARVRGTALTIIESATAGSGSRRYAASRWSLVVSRLESDDGRAVQVEPAERPLPLRRMDRATGRRVYFALSGADRLVWALRQRSGCRTRRSPVAGVAP